jgi:hypothetical protein
MHDILATSKAPKSFNELQSLLADDIKVKVAGTPWLLLLDLPKAY